MVSMVGFESRIFCAVNPWPVISAPLYDSTGVRILTPTRSTAGIISPTYAVVLLSVSSANAILLGSIVLLDRFDGRGACVLPESATCNVKAGVCIALPPASTICGAVSPSFGFLNYVLSLLHLPTLRWLVDPHTAMPSVILVGLWRGLGFNIITQHDGHTGEAIGVCAVSGSTLSCFPDATPTSPVVFSGFVQNDQFWSSTQEATRR